MNFPGCVGNSAEDGLGTSEKHHRVMQYVFLVLLHFSSKLSEWEVMKDSLHWQI